MQQALLRDYQQEAVDAIAHGLANGGRGQLHAACGSGKTLMSIHAALRLLPNQGLAVVLVPSLALTAQTITEWRTHAGPDAVLAVCSDDTVTDAPAHLEDIPATTTTDPNEVATWLSTHTGQRLIVSTYISAHHLAAALTQLGVEADFLIADESHHLAGNPDFVTRRVLEESFLPAKRRLFMTATPRTDDQRAESTGALTMDDTDVFGPVLYSYPFSRAITERYLDDYRIVVMGITEAKLWEMLREDGVEYVDRPGAPDLKVLAAHALIAKAAHTWGLRRVLAFCPRVADADEFASSMASTVMRLPPGKRPEGGLYVGRITGEMHQNQRDQVMQSLRHPPQQWSVVANVRCLSEGVDVPAVDGVVFTSPKSSQVDIVQAAGRALRRDPNGSGTATIIVPIVIPNSDEEVGDLEPGEFRTLWKVVRALRAHDDSLGIELDTHRSNLSTYNPGLPEKITIDLPEGASDRLLSQLKALTVKQATSVWWEGYGHARDYHAEHGHLDIPARYVTPDGFNLGTWIVNSRNARRKGWMRPDRVEALDKLGMIWDTREGNWSRFLQEIREFQERSGHVRVPQSYVSPSGYTLGSKVNRVRSNQHTVPSHVKQALDDLGMVWNTLHLRWMEILDAAITYQQEHGNLQVPNDYRMINGFRLGAALKARRARLHEGTLDPAEKAALEELDPEWAKPRKNQAWQKMLAACDRYVEKHGSLATVAKDYVDEDGYRLGENVSYYRNLYSGTKGKRYTLDPARKAALDERGMVWRLAPRRDITPSESETLRKARGTDLGGEIVRLVDEEKVTQSSIAEALGVHRSFLNTKLKRFRAEGVWPDRGRYQR